MNEFDSGDEFAVYDTSANTTGKMTIANVLGTSITGLGTTATTIPGAISELNTGLETVNTLLGSGDISSIDDGSVTGAISSLNTKIGNTSMGTTATTITGAIAEHESDISTLNSKMNYKAGDTLNKRPFRAMGRSINSGMGIFCWIELPKTVIASNFNMTIENINPYFESGTSPTFNNTVSNKYISGNELQFVFDTSNKLLVGRIYLLEFMAAITFV